MTLNPRIERVGIAFQTLGGIVLPLIALAAVAYGLADSPLDLAGIALGGVASTIGLVAVWAPRIAPRRFTDSNDELRNSETTLLFIAGTFGLLTGTMNDSVVFRPLFFVAAAFCVLAGVAIVAASMGDGS